MTKKGGKKGAKGGGVGQKHKKQNEPKNEKMEPLPNDRVQVVRPMWESLPQHERVQLLTLDLQLLRDKAHHTTELTKHQRAAMDHGIGHGHESIVLEPSLEEVLHEGINRLRERGTWKLWTWPTQPLPNVKQREFTEAKAFRQYFVENHISKDLVRFLPRDDPKAPERPAEEAFRQRMLDILARVQQQTMRQQEEQELFCRDDVKCYRELKNKQLMDPAGPTIVDQRPLEQQSVYRRRRHHAAASHAALRDSLIEMVNLILEALEKENEVLYSTVVNPIITYIMEVLPEEQRETHRGELSFADFNKLMPVDVAEVLEWLIEKVDALSTKLKAELKEEGVEEENLGDADLWSLTQEGNALTVSSKWLQYLQGRLLGEYGHSRKAKPPEDPHHCGLVLEWVYGFIVSPAERAHDGAKRPLGHILPAPEEGHAVLVRALEEQQMWESKLQQARSLLAEMLKSRMEASEVVSQYNVSAVPRHLKAEEVEIDDSIPDHAIIAVLRHEVLLTKAKLHFLVFEHLQQERVLHTHRSQLKQGGPEFDRLKREFEEVKQNHRSLDGTYRSQAEMERHRAQLTDQAIEEQLEVQTAFREQGALLQGIYDKKQRTEYDITKRETEVKQLQCWKGSIEKLVDGFMDLEHAKGVSQQQHRGKGRKPGTCTSAASMQDDNSQQGDKRGQQGGGESVHGSGVGAAQSKGAEGQGSVSESVGSGLEPQQHEHLMKLRSHFHKDVRKQLYTDADYHAFFDNLKKEVKAIEKRLDDAAVVIQHLEMRIINAACDDPSTTLGTQLLLPVLQERLDTKAKELAAERALMAQQEILRMEEEERKKAGCERERAGKATKKVKDKEKSAKAQWEKKWEEKKKEEAAEEEREAAEAKRRAEEDEQHRLQKEKSEKAREQAARVEREAAEVTRCEKEEAQRKVQKEESKRVREQAAKVEREAVEAKRRAEEEAQCKVQKEESERVHEQAAKVEREAEEAKRRAEEEAQRKLQEYRYKRFEERKVMLKAEVERWRQEMLSGKNSYQHQCMHKEEQAVTQSGASVAVGNAASAVEAPPTPQPQQQQHLRSSVSSVSSRGVGGKCAGEHEPGEQRKAHTQQSTGGEACAAPQQGFHNDCTPPVSKEDRQHAQLHEPHLQQHVQDAHTQPQLQQQQVQSARMQLHQLQQQQQQHVQDAHTQPQLQQQHVQDACTQPHHNHHYHHHGEGGMHSPSHPLKHAGGAAPAAHKQLLKPSDIWAANLISDTQECVPVEIYKNSTGVCPLCSWGRGNDKKEGLPGP